MVHGHRKGSGLRLLVCWWFAYGCLAQDGWLTERIEWEGSITPGTVIELVNEYGDIRVRGTNEMMLYLSAMVQSDSGDSVKIEFDIQQTEGRVQIHTVYPGSDDQTLKQGGLRRSDVTLFVPFGSPFEARTGKGLIEAKGLKSDVTLRSHSGRIFFRTEGRAQVSTYQGDIVGVLRRVDESQPSQLESVIGSISVTLPKDANLDVQIETRGQITTDYSLTIVEDKAGVKHAKAQIGRGGQVLKLVNKTGPVKVLKGQWDVPEQAP